MRIFLGLRKFLQKSSGLLPEFPALPPSLGPTSIPGLSFLEPTLEAQGKICQNKAQAVSSLKARPLCEPGADIPLWLCDSSCYSVTLS